MDLYLLKYKSLEEIEIVWRGREYKKENIIREMRENIVFMI